MSGFLKDPFILSGLIMCVGVHEHAQSATILHYLMPVISIVL